MGDLDFSKLSGSDFGAGEGGPGAVPGMGDDSDDDMPSDDEMPALESEEPKEEGKGKEPAK